MSEGWLFRLEQEERELSARIEKLHAFITTDAFERASADQLDLLRRQHMHMCDYRLVLRERIAAANDEQQA